mgnify:CR=1 FL=1
MRMRKKPWARPELEACKFFIQNPSEYKGRWKEFFGNDKPIYMELGCGKGTFMAVHGSENPDKNYITIDIKDEVLVLAKRNIEAAYEKKGQEIDNVALMSQEIAIIDNMLGDGDEISRIYINFCNPWPKDRHKKRRLTHPRQIEKYKKFLKNVNELNLEEIYNSGHQDEVKRIVNRKKSFVEANIEQYNKQMGLEIEKDRIRDYLDYLSEEQVKRTVLGKLKNDIIDELLDE